MAGSNDHSTPAPYDAIARDYAGMDVIFKQGVIGPSLHAVLRDLHGEAAIDWACGTGDFSTFSLVTKCNAGKVLGIDRSSEMIEQARARAAGFPQVKFAVGDVATMDVSWIEPVSVATGVFLLNYAENRSQLGQMYFRVAACLREGGRFVAVVPNPLRADIDTPQYGMRAHTDKGPNGLPYDGAERMAVLFPDDRNSFSFKTFWFSEETYLQEAAKAGLKICSIVFAAPSAEILPEFGRDFFQAYEMPYAQHLVYEFRKSGFRVLRCVFSLTRPVPKRWQHPKRSGQCAKRNCAVSHYCIRARTIKSTPCHEQASCLSCQRVVRQFKSRRPCHSCEDGVETTSCARRRTAR